MRVAVRVDASPLIGGGHAMRCLTLADALAARGADVTFVTSAMPDALAARIESSGHGLQRIPAPAGSERTGPDWHAPPLEAEAQAADASKTASGSVDWVIVDHYLLDTHWESAARNFARHVMAIDDLANRAHDCDLLLDQTFGRLAHDYVGRVPGRATLLTGARFALLRPEFERERSSALKRRKAGSGVNRVLVSMGTTDLGGSTASIVEDLLQGGRDFAIDVVLGRDAPSLPRVRRLAEGQSSISLHVDTRDMACLMRDSDVAVGAAGTTSWERCCLGLPAVAVILAENQRPSAMALAAAGAVITVERAQDAGASLLGVLGDQGHIAQMVAAAFAVTDGRGAARVAASIFGDVEESCVDGVELRSATVEDSEMLWLWRNDAATRAQSRNTDAISWDAHQRWLAAALADPRRRIWIGDQGGVAVGTVGVHAIEGGGSEVSITVAPDRRGTGAGRAMLAAICDQSRALDLYAAVRTGNEASRRLFETAGFRPVASTEPGFARYLRAGEDRPRKQA